MSRVVAIGAGLAGLISAIRLARAGADVTLVAKGLGGLPLSPGVIDVWGYQAGEPGSGGAADRPDAADSGSGAADRGSSTADRDSGESPRPTPIPDPMAAVEAAPSGHPYAAIGADAVRTGLELVRELAGGLLVGDGRANVLLPTAVGALRPTCLAQPSMLAPDADSSAASLAAAPADAEARPGRSAKWEKVAPESPQTPVSSDFEPLGASFSHFGQIPLAIVGLRRMKDFHPALIAGNLSRTTLPGGGSLSARPLMIDVPARSGEADSSGLTYARAFDEPGFALRVAAAIRPLLADGEAVGLPAVLGLRDRDAWRVLATELGHPVFEIALPPPSVAGLRLNDALTAAARAAGVRFVLGSAVTGVQVDGDRVASVTLATTGHPTQLRADAFVLATGGFESGGLAVDSYGTLSETTFGLPVWAPDGPPFTPDPWAPQPLFAAGLRVDAAMRPLDADGRPAHTNVHAAGGVLAGAQRWLELSGDGIALGSAVAATDAIGETR